MCRHYGVGKAAAPTVRYVNIGWCRVITVEGILGGFIGEDDDILGGSWETLVEVNVVCTLASEDTLLCLVCFPSLTLLWDTGCMNVDEDVVKHNTKGGYKQRPAG